MRLSPLLLLLLAASPPVSALNFTEAEVVHRISLQADGGALWTYERRVMLPAEVDRRAWDAIEPNFTPAHPDVARFREAMTENIARASRATGRPMTMDNLTATAFRESQTGVPRGILRVSFRWTGALAPGPRFGDIFLEGPLLGPSEALAVQYPPGWRATTLHPPLDIAREGEAVWLGPRDLGPGEPVVLLQPPAPEPGPLTWLLGATAAGLALLLAAVLLQRRRFDLDAAEKTLMELLEKRGEPVLQRELVRASGWSKARVSKVVASLEAKGRITKERRGRENLLTLKKRLRTIPKEKP